jgi:hypothetical protein
MGLLQKIGLSMTRSGRLLAQLASLTGRIQGLLDRLNRHAEACTYAHMKAKIKEVAAVTKAHVKMLNSILRDNRVWARLPEAPVHQGSNNWERVSGDLILLTRINVELNQQAVKWQGVNADVAQRLFAILKEQTPLMDTLQEIVARSDPQALD